jgi:hypothetical protein
MHMVVYSVAALSVAVIFYAWRARQEIAQLRERRLRERVTYMLWVMANTMPE